MLVVTTFEHDDYVFDALRAGASGFVLKRVQPEELAQAIRIVATGESLVFPALTRALVERHNVQLEPGDRRAELVASLTEREAEILRLVARGLSNQEIADDARRRRAHGQVARRARARQARERATARRP